MQLAYFVFLLLGVCFGTLKARPGEDFERDESPSTNIPRLISSSVTLAVKEGDTALLPCKVEDLGEYVLLWKKGPTQVLYAGILRVLRDDRLKLMNDMSLEISQVRKNDSGQYICQISTNPPREVMHTLNILAPPTVSVIPAEGKIVKKKGEAFSLSCDAGGNPDPQVQWTRKGQNILLPGGQKSIKGDSLSISEAEATHSGIYICEANNGVGQPARGEIMVHVLFAPEIAAANNWVHAGEDASSEITCSVDAEPPASVNWQRSDGRSIEPSDDFKFKTEGNTHTLQIRKVTEDLFDNYTCIANNSMGRTSETIEVSGLASQIKFLSSPWGPEYERYDLKWETRSYSPVIQYLLKYRKMKNEIENDTEWHEVFIPMERNSGLVQQHSFEMKDLERAAEYEVIIQAKNDYGWNRPNQPFVFNTKGKVFSNTLDDPAPAVGDPSASRPGGENGAFSSLQCTNLSALLTLLAIVISSYIF